MKQQIAIDVIVLLNYYYILLKEITIKLRLHKQQATVVLVVVEGDGGGISSGDDSSTSGSSSSSSSGESSICNCSRCCYQITTQATTCSYHFSQSASISLDSTSNLCIQIEEVSREKGEEEEERRVIRSHHSRRNTIGNDSGQTEDDKNDGLSLKNHYNYKYFYSYNRSLLLLHVYRSILVGLLLIRSPSSVHNHNKYNITTQSISKQILLSIY
jgi:hypothetical protein